LSPPPRVSVVIPAYKAARYITEALESVFGQKFVDYEVIVVNDGSPDTAELERVLAPYRARIVYLKQDNRGAAAARNAGLRAARGELAAFLDADDAWLPEYLDRQVLFLRERGCDLVCADALIFGESALAGRTYMDAYMASAPAKGDATFLDLLSAERCLITSGVVARRQPILDAGLFDEELRNAHDYDLWLRLARGGARLAFHREVLLRYRGHSDSLSGDEINVNLRELRVFDKVASSYELAPEERAETLAVMRKRRAALEFELGKLYLLKGDFADARRSFATAAELGSGWKPRAALWLVRAAPRLLRACYGRRVDGKRR
jgi:glycosyltransferase involved in cell wall biosynthesis